MVLPARLVEVVGRSPIFLVLAALTAFAAAASPEFATPENLANVLNQTAALAVLALGQTIVIVAGLIDLSVGQLLGLVAVLVSDFVDGSSARTAPAIVLRSE